MLPIRTTQKKVLHRHMLLIFFVCLFFFVCLLFFKETLDIIPRQFYFQATIYGNDILCIYKNVVSTYMR